MWLLGMSTGFSKEGRDINRIMIPFSFCFVFSIHLSKGVQFGSSFSSSIPTLQLCRSVLSGIDPCFCVPNRCGWEEKRHGLIVVVTRKRFVGSPYHAGTSDLIVYLFIARPHSATVTFFCQRIAANTSAIFVQEEAPSDYALFKGWEHRRGAGKARASFVNWYFLVALRYVIWLRDNKLLVTFLTCLFSAYSYFSYRISHLFIATNTHTWLILIRDKLTSIVH